MREMKNSGVAWIGDVPENWEIVKIGQLFQCRNVKVNDTDFQPLSVSKGGIVPQMENVAKSDANDNRKQVLTGDFVINSRSDRKQSCGVSKLDGSVSLINTVLYGFDKDRVIPEYNNYLLKNYGFAEEFYRWGHGIVADLWTTRWQEMKNIEIPVPSIKTQEDILSALRIKSKNISLLIFNQEQQIEKLKQYKQSLITEVVAKGLNPDVTMKDSGVKWIGQIPENWTIKPLKSLFGFGKGLPITKENLQTNGVPVISYGQIHAKWNSGVTIHDELKRFVSETYIETNPNSLVKYGDFIFADTSEDREGCGNCVYVDKSETLFAGYHTVILTSSSQRSNKYLAYLFLTDAWRSQIRCKVSGIKVFSISRKILSSTSIILPDIAEQNDIVSYLDDKCAKIDRLIAIKQEKINKLNDYKKSLIYEYVTGKREVC